MSFHPENWTMTLLSKKRMKSENDRSPINSRSIERMIMYYNIIL